MPATPLPFDGTPQYQKPGQQRKADLEERSIGGFCVEGRPGTLSLGDKFKIEVIIPFGDFDVAFTALARLEWINDDNQDKSFGASFLELEERHESLLRYFAESLLNGEMASIENTIRRLDVPVSLVSEKPDVDKSTAAALPVGQDARGKSTLRWSAFYLGLGALFTIYLLLTAYENIFHVRVDSAKIVGADSIMLSPFDGYVADVYAKEGDTVAAGQVIFKIENTALQEKLEAAALDIDYAEADVLSKEDALALQKEKINSYRKFGEAELKIAKAKVDAYQEQLNYASKRYERILALRKEGLASEEQLDSALNGRVKAGADLQGAIGEWSKARNAISEIDQGRYFTDRKLEGEVAEMASELANAKRRLALAKKSYQLLQRHQNRLLIRAPHDGKLVSVAAVRNQFVSAKKPIFSVQGLGLRSVEAIVAADEIQKIRNDARAEVYVAGIDEPLPAKILSIDRGAYFNPEVLNDYSDIVPPVKVRLGFVGSDELPQEAYSMQSGLPVVVKFSSRSMRIFASDSVAERGMQSPASARALVSK